MKEKTWGPIIIAGIIALVFVWNYFVYWIDKLAKFTGYKFAFFAVPGIIFGFLIICAMLLLPQINRRIFITSWLWLIIGVFLAYLPVLIYIFVLTDG